MFLTTAKPLIDEGRVVGLGHTGDGPWFQLPQLKPLTALGLKDFRRARLERHHGAQGHAASSGRQVERRALANALHSDAAAKAFNAMGFIPGCRYARTNDQADRRGYAYLHHRDPRTKPEVR
jgi:hypothetical protein